MCQNELLESYSHTLDLSEALTSVRFHRKATTTSYRMVVLFSAMKLRSVEFHLPDLFCVFEL